MMDFTLITLWLFGTIVLATVACLLSKHYGAGFLIAVFTACIVIANAVGYKLVSLGPFTVSATLIIYSVSFLLTDTLSELWGKDTAKKAIWAGLMSILLFVFVSQISIYLLPASYWTGQEAFREVFANSWRIALASLTAYILVQYHDVIAFHFWKRKTKGKHLWLRNNASTWVSQAFDTVLFYSIAFYGMFPILPLILSTLLLKVIIALIDTPFLYFIRWYFRSVGERWRRGGVVSA